MEYTAPFPYRRIPIAQRLTAAFGAVIVALGILFLVTGLPVAAESSEPIVKLAKHPQLGKFLVDAKGMTLYLFTRDQPGVSNCYDQCARNWPPLLATTDAIALPAGLAGQLGVTTRRDGTKQVTYNGWPLYYWIGDRKPGDTTGNGVNQVWWVVNPAPVLQVRESSTLGKFLVDAEGMTLYLFTRDQPGVSNCYDQCAINWPPLVLAYGTPTAASGIQGDLGLITRKDGTKQVTYKGMPLYYWIGDRAPGDATGQNVGGVWFVVQP